jgi:hypothetical protein
MSLLRHINERNVGEKTKKNKVTAHWSNSKPAISRMQVPRIGFSEFKWLIFRLEPRHHSAAFVSCQTRHAFVRNLKPPKRTKGTEILLVAFPVVAPGCRNNPTHSFSTRRSLFLFYLRE